MRVSSKMIELMARSKACGSASLTCHWTFRSSREPEPVKQKSRERLHQRSALVYTHTRARACRRRQPARYRAWETFSFVGRLVQQPSLFPSPSQLCAAAESALLPQSRSRRRLVLGRCRAIVVSFCRFSQSCDLSSRTTKHSPPRDPLTNTYSLFLSFLRARLRELNSLPGGNAFGVVNSRAPHRLCVHVCVCV